MLRTFLSLTNVTPQKRTNYGVIFHKQAVGIQHLFCTLPLMPLAEANDKLTFQQLLVYRFMKGYIMI